MSSKRRTFHVDWDSPSHATGTVKRRPASLSAPLSIPSDCFENVEYYEVKDCIGGYGLRLLQSFDGRLDGRSNADPGFVESRSNGMEGGAIKDNGNCFEHPRSRTAPRKEEVPDVNGGSGKFMDSTFSCDNRLSDSETVLVSIHDFDATILEDLTGDTKRDEQVESVNEDYDGRQTYRIQGVVYTEVDHNVDILDSSSDVIIKRDKEQGTKKNSKVNIRKDFGLKLFREPFEWRSKTSRVTKVPGSQKLETAKRKSLIPKPKTKRDNRGLVNSSSESSGIGSPLSPLSPQKDASINVRDDVSRCPIRTSGSKSSGLGSPDSPLSPESQKYAAFYLIEEQLEKLRNCPCEKRQAELVSAKIENITYNLNSDIVGRGKSMRTFRVDGRLELQGLGGKEKVINLMSHILGAL
ncbi:hypothetical protein WN55_03424 [Dufourea novaeangliae]|uniref:Uncharacterized protein n=1 Tax=Dufourea novaeangliae TaxID=178035 RepID=A0A154PL14_DUFNO|nr:hypothetical protein WN55_03424 [Dufourea novaeangliae]